MRTLAVISLILLFGAATGLARAYREERRERRKHRPF